jgi:hypothetical protein
MQKKIDNIIQKFMLYGCSKLLNLNCPIPIDKNHNPNNKLSKENFFFFEKK